MNKVYRDKPAYVNTVLALALKQLRRQSVYTIRYTANSPHGECVQNLLLVLSTLLSAWLIFMHILATLAEEQNKQYGILCRAISLCVDKGNTTQLRNGTCGVYMLRNGSTFSNEYGIENPKTTVHSTYTYQDRSQATGECGIVQPCGYAGDKLRVKYTCNWTSHCHGKSEFQKKKIVFTRNLASSVRKRLIKCYIWIVVLCGAESWAVQRIDRKTLKGMKCADGEEWWGSVGQIVWEMRKYRIQSTGEKHPAYWVGHMLRSYCLIGYVTEGKNWR
jgi:hypothetical protein